MYSVFLSSRKGEAGTCYFRRRRSRSAEAGCHYTDCRIVRSLVPGVTLIHLPAVLHKPLHPASFSHSGERATTSANETIASCFRRPPELPNTTSGAIPGRAPRPHTVRTVYVRPSDPRGHLQHPARPENWYVWPSSQFVILEFWGVARVLLPSPGPWKSQVAWFDEHLPNTF